MYSTLHWSVSYSGCRHDEEVEFGELLGSSAHAPQGGGGGEAGLARLRQERLAADKAEEIKVPPPPSRARPRPPALAHLGAYLRDLRSLSQ